MNEKKIDYDKIRNRIIELLRQEPESEVSFQKIFNDPKIQKLISETRHETNQRFKLLIKDIFKGNAKINVKDNSVSRIKKYAKLKDRKGLEKLVEETTEGLLIDDEILNFSYRNVKQDIDTGLKKNKFRKIDSSNKKDYFIFPRNCENEETTTHSAYLGIQFYLKVCRQENLLASNQGNDLDNQKNKMSKKPNKSWNDWVPNYAQQKEAWLKKNGKK